MTEPKIRFRTDDGSAFPDWEEVRFGDVFTEISQKTSDTDTYPLYSLTIEDGVTAKSERYERSYLLTKNEDNYKIVPPNAFVYNPMNLRFGALAPNHQDMKVCVSQYYNVFEIKDESTLVFWENYLVSSLMLKHYFSIATGSLIEKLRVHYTNFVEIRKRLPSLPEQQKIADFLNNVDEVIAASEEEVANLEQQKKAAMQKIFSQEVRFKKENGSDFPDWEETKILDLLIQPITDGPHETPILVEEGVPFVSVEAVENGRINLSKRRGNITKEYDIICAKKYKPQLYDVYMVKSGATTGKLAIVTTEDDFNIWSPLAAMRTASKTEAFFLFYLLQSDILQKQVWTKLSLGNQPNLGMRALEAFDAVRPCLEEQHLIADFLISYDEAITVAKQELAKWKELKKGLLQQMFV